jgi:1-acyl-sn-glycerol-3-phosphate acyltransferase
VRLDRDVHHRIDRLELPFNALGLDPYGVSKAHLRVSLTALAAAYRWYFSVKTHGIEHVPPRGRAMLVGNHSGGIAIDAAMVLVSCLREARRLHLEQARGEAFPTVANGYRLGKLLGVPYVPIVAYGLPIPLPAKIEIHYGAPMRFSGTGNEDDQIVFGYVDKVKEAIAGMLAAGARRRRGEAPQLKGAS